MSTGYYLFPAIRGYQGNYEYYLIQCLIRLVPRLFIFDDSEIPADLRQGYELQSHKVTELRLYLMSYPKDYVLSSLIAAVDSEVTFKAIAEDCTDIGYVHIPLSAQMVLHDGQHRREAIREIVEQGLALGNSNDTIPVMLFPDPHMSRFQRLYADLNRSRVQSTQSQRVLHDYESPLATLVRQLVEGVSLFNGRIELERTTISNRSTALFTLSALYQATQALLGVGKYDPISPSQRDIAFTFWSELGQIIPEWRNVIQGEETTSHLRQHYVHAHGVTLLAIGMAGHQLIHTYPDTWQDHLSVLGDIDWSRENTELWEGRAMIRGKMSKANDSIKLTTNAIKRVLGLPLTDKEQELEDRMHSS